jgi:hypothetical protein
MADTREESDLAMLLSNEIRKEERTLGQASDWPDFKERSGRIKGLKKALEIEEDQAKRMLEYDEDDDEDDDL